MVFTESLIFFSHDDNYLLKVLDKIGGVQAATTGEQDGGRRFSPSRRHLRILVEKAPGTPEGRGGEGPVQQGQKALP